MPDHAKEYSFDVIEFTLRANRVFRFSGSSRKFEPLKTEGVPLPRNFR